MLPSRAKRLRRRGQHLGQRVFEDVQQLVELGAVIVSGGASTAIQWLARSSSPRRLAASRTLTPTFSAAGNGSLVSGSDTNSMPTRSP